MAYKKDGYTLYTIERKLKSGKKMNLYFFSKKKPKRGKPIDLPAGYKVIKNKRTGLPMVKKK